MQRLLLDLITFKNRVFQQGVDQQPAKPSSTNAVQPTEHPDSLVQPALGILDEETLRLYKAMDLAG